jgi:hypothetical protein
MNAWGSTQGGGDGGVGPPRTSADSGSAPFRRMATVIMPADKDYLALARTSTMQIAALLDLSMSRVTDLRLAVDEACTSFLVGRGEAGEPSGEAGNLELYYDRFPERLHVTVCGTAAAGWPTRDELGWEMLRALVGEVRAEIVAGTGVLTLIEPLPEADQAE